MVTQTYKCTTVCLWEVVFRYFIGVNTLERQLVFLLYNIPVFEILLMNV